MTRTVEEAWAVLVGVSLAQRRTWIEASNAEGLTPPQAMSLMTLRADAPRRLGDLARHMHCDASYATALADRLEERGFVARRVSATDRRVKELVLTETGSAAQARLRGAYTAPPPGLTDLPEADQDALRRIAAALSANADPEIVARFAGVRPEGAPG